MCAACADATRGATVAYTLSVSGRVTRNDVPCRPRKRSGMEPLAPRTTFALAFSLLTAATASSAHAQRRPDPPPLNRPQQALVIPARYIEAQAAPEVAAQPVAAAPATTVVVQQAPPQVVYVERPSQQVVFVPATPTVVVRDRWAPIGFCPPPRAVCAPRYVADCGPRYRSSFFYSSSDCGSGFSVSVGIGSGGYHGRSHGWRGRDCDDRRDCGRGGRRGWRR